jgi:membrane fusion protein (multidrug efflux system)
MFRPVCLALLSTVTSLLAAETPAPEVRLASPTRGDITRFVPLPGSLRANQQVTLFPKVAGHVERIAVDRGTSVKAGAVIAELAVPELQAERARQSAELRLAAADLQRIRSARVKAPDLITPSAFDAAEAKVAVAQAALDRTTALVGFSRIVAPFDGIVTTRFVDVGAFVPAASSVAGAANGAIVTLMDLAVIRATVAVPEIEASRVAVGQPVQVTVDGIPGRVFKGTVSRQSYALEEGNRSLLVEADLPNPELALRPGMYAMIKVGVERHSGALLIPADALVREKTAAFVFTLADGKVTRVPVKVGFSDGPVVEILEGVAENARLALPGKNTLVSGQAVRVIEAK